MFTPNTFPFFFLNNMPAQQPAANPLTGKALFGKIMNEQHITVSETFMPGVIHVFEELQQMAAVIARYETAKKEGVNPFGNGLF
jgi:hypothetical protein